MYKCLPNITVFAEEMSPNSTKSCAQKVRASISTLHNKYKISITYLNFIPVSRCDMYVYDALL